MELFNVGSYGVVWNCGIDRFYWHLLFVIITELFFIIVWGHKRRIGIDFWLIWLRCWLMIEDLIGVSLESLVGDGRALITPLLCPEEIPLEPTHFYYANHYRLLIGKYRDRAHQINIHRFMTWQVSKMRFPVSSFSTQIQ